MRDHLAAHRIAAGRVERIAAGRVKPIAAHAKV